MSIAIQRSKTKVNKHIQPVLEWAKVLHAAVLSGSVAHCAQSVKLFNNRDGNR